VLDAAIEFLNTGRISLVTSAQIIRKQASMDKQRTDPFKDKRLNIYIDGY